VSTDIIHPVGHLVQEGVYIYMINLSQEIAVSIVEQVIKVIPYFEVDIKEQLNLRYLIEEKLNDYQITSRCTDLTKGDIIEKAFLFLACKKLEGMAESTRYNYILIFKRMDAYFNKPLSTITTMDLRLFIAKSYKDNQPNSTNNKICKVKEFFTWLQDEGYIVQNPSRNLLQVKEPYRRRGYIQAIDIEKMREQCQTIREKTLFEFLLSTGCRVSEVSNATIDKINWQENSITVIGKGNKERVVFLVLGQDYLF
jgi:integrase/recombinase XerD